MPQSSQTEAFGQISQTSGTSDFNAVSFLVAQMLAKIQTVTLVEVVGVTNAGELSPVGFVDVRPLVNQMTGDRKAVPHGTIYHLPYFRLQGGGNAIILDPQQGDIGMCGFCSRDISSVKASKAAASPGSFRTFDFADGLYFGGMLNGTPTQYVQFNATGIKMHSPHLINLDAPDVQINAQTVEINATTSATVNTPTFTVNGNTVLNGMLSQGMGTSGGSATMLGPVTVTNDVTAGGKSLETHVHSGVQTGSGNTGTPV